MGEEEGYEEVDEWGGGEDEEGWEEENEGEGTCNKAFFELLMVRPPRLY